MDARLDSNMECYESYVKYDYAEHDVETKNTGIENNAIARNKVEDAVTPSVTEDIR